MNSREYQRWQHRKEREQARARLELDELTVTGELPADSPFTLAGTLYYDPETDTLEVRNDA